MYMYIYKVLNKCTKYTRRVHYIHTHIKIVLVNRMVVNNVMYIIRQLGRK